MQKIRYFLPISLAFIFNLALQPVLAGTTDQLPDLSHTLAVRNEVRGRILLQVESHGEAWYVDPVSGYRYYMPDGASAYSLLRSFGLGISNADLASLTAGNADLQSRLKGRILLQVQSHGEAYYVHPDTGAVTYMQDGNAAYTIMRAQSLGISNADLSLVPSRSLAEAANDSAGVQIGISSFQAGNIPAGVDVQALNEYWTKRMNGLRAARGLRQIVIDPRLIDTATAYAADQGIYNRFTHTRRDGENSHEWIQQFDLPFTERDVPGGWVDNYFGENITWGYATGSTDSVIKHMEDSLAVMLAEGPGGAHYDTIYHRDWNSIGLGFYFQDVGNGYYKVWVVYHYASLE